MIKVKFNDNPEFYSAYYKQVSEHVCKLCGTVPQNTSGFTTYLPNGEPLGDRSLYTTIYKVDEDGIEFSDDESIYTEPAPVEIEEFPMDMPVDPTPTIEERVSDLENAVIELYESVGA